MNETCSEHGAAGLRERLIRLVRQLLEQPMAFRPLPIDARLSELGISSIKLVNLMLSIEAECNITIPQAEITPDNFQSIASIEAMIQRLQRSTG